MTTVEMLRQPHRPVPFRQQGPEHFAQERPTLFYSAEIDARMGSLADQVVEDYGLNVPNLFPLADGAIHTARLLKDKLKARGMNVEIYPMKATSRTNGMRESENGKVQIVPSLYEMTFDINRPPLIVEDLLDSGLTLTTVRRLFEQYFEFIPQNPRLGDHIKPRILTLLEKISEEGPKYPVELNYVGWKIPAKLHWVEGFGMDTDDDGRDNENIIVRNDLQKAMMLEELHKGLTGLRDGK